GLGYFEEADDFMDWMLTISCDIAPRLASRVRNSGLCTMFMGKLCRESGRLTIFPDSGIHAPYEWAMGFETNCSWTYTARYSMAPLNTASTEARLIAKCSGS